MAIPYEAREIETPKGGLEFMNETFVKDSLLPDETILATASFHKIRNYVMPIILIVLSAIMYFILTESNSRLVSNSYIVYEYHNDNGNYTLIFGKNTSSDDRGERFLYSTGKTEVFPHMTKREFEAMTGVNTDYLKWHIKSNTSPTKSLIWLFVTVILSFGLFDLSKWVNSKDEFVLTNKRIMAKVGVIRRVAFELQSNRVESILVHQGIIGRLLNFGTLMPCGIGASKVCVPFVIEPFEFRQHFYNLKEETETEHLGAMPPQ